jgi:hypothetical protein
VILFNRGFWSLNCTPSLRLFANGGQIRRRAVVEKYKSVFQTPTTPMRAVPAVSGAFVNDDPSLPPGNQLRPQSEGRIVMAVYSAVWAWFRYLKSSV